MGTHGCAHVNMYGHTHVFTNVYTHAYTHVHTHMSAHTLALPGIADGVEALSYGIGHGDTAPIWTWGMRHLFGHGHVTPN